MSKSLLHVTETSRTIFSNIPLLRDYKRVRLGEVCKIQNGYAFSSSDFVSEGIPVLKMGNISKDFQVRLKPEKFSYLPESFARTHSSFLLRKGDLLITLTDMSPSGEYLGTVAIYDSGMPALLNQRVGRFYDIDESVDISFLYYILRSSEFRKYATDDDTGNLQKNTNPEYLYRFELSLPPFSEQRRIAAILNEQMTAVDQARAAAEAQLEAAKTLPSIYLNEAFEGITPLTTNPVPDGAPEGWQWVLLTDFAQLESGHTPSRYHPEWWGGNIPWIALPDIRALDGKIAFETSEYTNEAGIANSSSRILPKDTVVLSRTASVGFVTIMGRSMATSQDFVNWICGPNLDPHFLALLLRASRDFIHSASSGAVHKTVYMPTVKSFRVCIPPLAKQKQSALTLNRKLEHAERMRLMLQDQLNAIDKLPAALLRQAFTGKF